MSADPRRGDRPWTLPVALLLGIGLAVTWTGAFLFDLQLQPVSGPWPRLDLPPIPDAGVLPAAAGGATAEDVRREALQPLGGQALLAAGLVAVVALLQLVMTLWSRAVARAHEMAVRRVLGPGLLRLLRPLLAGIGPMMGRGLAAAAAITAVLAAEAWITAPPGTRIAPGLDLAVAGAGSLLLLGTVLLFGLLPAAAPPTRVLESLRAGGRVTSHGSGGAIITTQVAFAVALLYAGAVQDRHVEPGGGPDRDALLVRLQLDPGGAEGTEPARLLATVRDRLGSRGGAGAVMGPGAALGLAPRLGFLTECPGCSVGGLPTPIQGVDALVAPATPGFLDTLGLLVLDGRSLAGPNRDAVLVNEAFVATGAVGTGSVIGRTLSLSAEPDRPRTIVGVVGDLPVAGERKGRARPTVYVPWPPGSLPAAVDVLLPLEPGDDVAALASTVRGIVGVRSASVTTVRAERRRADARVAWLGRWITLLGLLAFLVAGYGTLQATRGSIRLRRRELGIRLALGAPGRRLMTTVALATLRRVAVGTALSALLILLLAPDSRWDAGVFTAIAALVAGLAVVGGLLPARAAAAVPPAVVLRDP